VKNTSTPGIDRCLYELWKKLKEKYNEKEERYTLNFSIINTLIMVFEDIQKHGVDPNTNFSLE
jgi:hypothetical protein